MEERGGGHRLEPALSFHLRHAGGHPGEIRAFRTAATPPQHNAASDPRGGQVRNQGPGAVPGGGKPRRGLPGAEHGGPAPDRHGQTWVWCGLSPPCPADHAQQRERHGDQDHRAGEHDHKQRSGRPSNGDHAGHDPVPHRADGAGAGATSTDRAPGTLSTPSPQRTGRASWRRTWPSSTEGPIPGAGPKCPIRSTPSRPWITMP